MPTRPNILVLMSDHSQGRTLAPGHPCQTPNAVCSPAPAHAGRVKEMLRLMWRYISDTKDQALLNTQYPILRLAAWGPLVLDE